MKKKLLYILIVGILIFPVLVFAAECKEGTICLENPLGEQTDIASIMGNLVATALGIMGSLALLVFIVGGFMWMTAGGNPEKVKKGTQAMMWAAIGIIVIFSSYAIIRLVLEGLGVADPEIKKLDNTKASCFCVIDNQPSIGMSGPLYDTEGKCMGSVGGVDPTYAIGGGIGQIISCDWLK